MSIARRLPVFWLTIRQFRAGNGVKVVAFFAIISIVLDIIYLSGTSGVVANRFLASTYLELLAPTIIPLATLILATSAFGNEVGDRTLPYLTLKPVSRLRIVLEKYAGVVAIIGLAFVVSLAITWGLLASGSDGATQDMLVSLIVATMSGVLAYGAFFLLVSLVVPRALLIGIIYVLIWESTLARFIPGIKLVSIRHFTQSIFVNSLSDPPINLPDAVQLNSALITLGILVVVSLVLAAWRLRQMDLD